MAWIWYRTVKGNSVHSHGSWIPKSFAPWQDVRKSWQSIRPGGRDRKCVTCVCVYLCMCIYTLYIYIHTYICACAFLCMCLCGLAMQFEARMQPCAATLACKKCKLLPSVCSMAHHGSPWLSMALPFPSEAWKVFMARLLLVEQISVSSPESEKAKSLGPSLGRILQSFRFVLEKLQSQSPLRGLAQICSIWEEQTPKKNPNLWKSLTRCQQQQIDLGSVFRICPGGTLL